MKNGLIVSCLLIVACRSPTLGNGSNVPGSCEAQQALIPPQKLDVLFVIDNSGSMSEEQQAVANNLSAFVSELRTRGGVPQDFNVGVITTSVYQYVVTDKPRYLWPGQAGLLQGTVSGSDPELLTKFAALVKQGTDGSGQETPFEAVRLALTLPSNFEFFRPGARLLVVILTDEDDCSELGGTPTVFVGDGTKDWCHDQASKLTPVRTYFDLFKASGREIVWTVIGPVGRDANRTAQSELVGGSWRNVDCPTSSESGERHREMALLWRDDLANIDSICRSDYRQTLIDIAGLANVPQILDINGVPDPELLQVTIVRADGTHQMCTVSNGGITWDGQAHFDGACRRRADDVEVKVQMFCAG
jgi:hypothetical protein